jgi:hypothetical protein
MAAKTLPFVIIYEDGAAILGLLLLSVEFN